jgi:hypothetical protein
MFISSHYTCAGPGAISSQHIVDAVVRPPFVLRALSTCQHCLPLLPRGGSLAGESAQERP